MSRDWALSSVRGNLSDLPVLLSKEPCKNTPRVHVHNRHASLKMQNWANHLFAPKSLGCLCTNLSLILPIPIAPIFLVSLSSLLVSLSLSLKYVSCSKVKKESQSEGLKDIFRSNKSSIWHVGKVKNLILFAFYWAWELLLKAIK